MELMRERGHEVALFSMQDPRGKPTPYDRHFVPHIDFKAKAGLARKADRLGMRFIPGRPGAGSGE